MYIYRANVGVDVYNILSNQITKYSTLFISYNYEMDLLILKTFRLTRTRISLKI